MADHQATTTATATGATNALASMQGAPPRWQVLTGLAVLALSASLTLLFFEGDSCLDAGGAFHALAYRCELADGRHYVSLVWKARWPFWGLYAVITLFVAAPLCALGVGLAAGLDSGLRSLWFDGVRNGAAPGRPSA